MMVNETMQTPGSLTFTQQNYVESIAHLVEQNGYARTSDIATFLGVSLPSVSEEVGRLAALSIAVRKSWHEIVLTREGKRIARQLDKRHKTLRRFMVDVLAMDAGKADQLACRTEHFIDREFVDRLLRLAEFLEHECAEHRQSMRQYVKPT